MFSRMDAPAWIQSLPTELMNENGIITEEVVPLSFVGHRHSIHGDFPTMFSDDVSDEDIFSNKRLHRRLKRIKPRMLGDTSWEYLSTSSSDLSILENLYDVNIISGTPQKVLELYDREIPQHEKKEILNYKFVYYFTSSARHPISKVLGNLHSDDKYGFYRYREHDQIFFRYEILRTIGKGSFAHVVEAVDHKTEELVALKITRNCLRLREQYLQEAEILRILNYRDRKYLVNVVKLFDHFIFRKHICLSFELLWINLRDYIKKNNSKGLEMDMIREISRQLIECVYELKRLRIIHCDLKSDNIMLVHKDSMQIKVIDFGCCCYEYNRPYKCVQAISYRAPEVVLRLKYNCAIDIWSIGCILVELFTGQILFPAQDEKQLMAMMMEVIGLPPSHFISLSARKYEFITPEGLPRYHTRSLKHDRITTHLEESSTGLDVGRHIREQGSNELFEVLEYKHYDVFMDFLSKCLKWEPNVRISADLAVCHPWIKRLVYGLNIEQCGTDCAICEQNCDTKRVWSSPTMMRVLLENARLGKPPFHHTLFGNGEVTSKKFSSLPVPDYIPSDGSFYQDCN